MSIAFLGRISADGIDHVQTPFKTWLESVLDQGDYIVVAKGGAEHESPMPSLRVFPSVIVERDVIIEVFPQGSARGLAFAMYLPAGIDRMNLIGALERAAPANW